MKNNQMIPYNRALANKDGREGVALGVIAKIEDGELDPIDAILNARLWKDVFELLEKNERFKELLRTEVAKYGKSSAEIGGHKIQESETGVTYHFENTNDPIYARLEEEAKKANAALKQRAEFLKKVAPEGIDVFDNETGELVRVYPPYKTSTTTFRVTLNK